AIQNGKSKVVCAMCKQCLITTNHDVCMLKYVNAMNSHGNKQNANVLDDEYQKKHKPKAKKPKKVYNRRTKKIIETMNVKFDELSAMAFEQRSSKPMLQGMTSRQINLLLEGMYDDYIGGPLAAPRTAPAAHANQNLLTPNASTTIKESAPTPTNSSS
nr:hypothetical protein [Tanacetum cinerariifolium]